MSASASVLLAYGLLIAIHLVAIGSHRGVLVLRGQRAANSFAPDGQDVSAFSARLCRVHANTYECFPWIAAPLIVALATGQTAVTDPLAWWLFGARIGQTLVHLASTSTLAVQARFAFFLVQLGIAVHWAVKLLAG